MPWRHKARAVVPEGRSFGRWLAATGSLLAGGDSTSRALDDEAVAVCTSAAPAVLPTTERLEARPIERW